MSRFAKFLSLLFRAFLALFLKAKERPVLIIGSRCWRMHPRCFGMRFLAPLCRSTAAGLAGYSVQEQDLPAGATQQPIFSLAGFAWQGDISAVRTVLPHLPEQIQHDLAKLMMQRLAVEASPMQ